MKNVLILGATSEVSLALAELLATKGCNLILASRNVIRLAPVQSDLHIRYGIHVTLTEFDAEKPQNHADFYEQLETKPDTAIYVAGYLGNQLTAQNNWQESEKILYVNYVGAVSILNRIAADFEIKKQGVIVGVGSVAGDRGRQSNYLYGSSKAGFASYLSGLRNRLFKSGVHVVTVKPGFINTRMLGNLVTPAIITAQPNEVAKRILKAIHKQKDVVYVLPVWWLIMLMIKSIPEFIFKRLKL